MPALWQAYLNMASGWPPPNSTTSAPSSLRQSKSASGSRPVRKKPSISLIWAKWTTPGASPLDSGPKAWLSADWTTWAEPSLSAAMAETPGGDTDQSASSPSSARNPPAIVAISGE